MTVSNLKSEFPHTVPTVLVTGLRKRASRPKVRSGCVTCKKRRVKCDEGKPACHNCVRLELVCHYEAPKEPSPPRQPPPRRRAAPLVALQQRAILPAPKSNQEVSVPWIPYQSAWGKLNSVEVAYFDFYRDNIAPYMGRADFWLRSVMRSSLESTCIRDLVAAIAALAQAIPAAPEGYKFSARNTNWVNEHHSTAIRYYTDALAKYRAQLSQEPTTLPPRLILMVNFLLMTFEGMQGNVSAVDTLMTHGVMMLKDKLPSLQPGERTKGVATSLDDEGVQDMQIILPRMAAMNALGAPIYPSLKKVRFDVALDDLVVDLPDNASLLEVERSWEKFSTACFLWIVSAEQSLREGPPGSYGKLTEAQEAQRRMVMEQNDVFHAAIQKIMNREKDIFKRQLWKTFTLGARTVAMFAACFDDPTDMAWDQYLTLNRQIVEMADFVINRPHHTFRGRTLGRDPTLGKDRMLTILDRVVTKCRDRQVRGQAWGLLQQVMSGIQSWDVRAYLMGSYIRIAIEEAGRLANGTIPPDARWKWTDCAWGEEGSGLFTLTFTRVVPDEFGQPVHKTFDITPQDTNNIGAHPFDSVRIGLSGMSLVSYSI
ncbi:hypothetical protein F4778DRAFT_290880 [Xylariomycetidae sp. FL2044]|nr:hypothetical protein F4778DRAFT_290880 [Xylariomycetidae sp. FL2044]